VGEAAHSFRGIRARAHQGSESRKHVSDPEDSPGRTSKKEKVVTAVSSPYQGPSRIVSGGQTGADQAGLRAAKALGIETGGLAPMGYRTEAGPCEELRSFGLIEDDSYKYAARTRKNIENSDATVIFGDLRSPGSLLTFQLCHELGKPCLVVDPRFLRIDMEHRKFRRFLDEQKPVTLNIAGNRESKRFGIGLRVKEFLVEGLTKFRKEVREHAGGDQDR